MALSVLTNDGKAVNQSWDSFLSDEAIGSQIKLVETTGEARATTTSFIAEPARFFGLKFNSAANASRFKLLTPFANQGKKDVILLGLEQKLTWSGTLNQILTAFIGEPKVPGDGVVAKILSSLLKALAGQVPVTLVNPEKDPEVRNGLWCVTGQTRIISTALIFVLDLKKPADPKTETDPNKTALDSIKKTLQNELAIDIGDLGPLTFHLQRTSYGTPLMGEDKKLQWSIINTWSLIIQITISGFDFWLQQDSGETSVILTQNKDTDTDIWTKLGNLGQKTPELEPPPGTDPDTPMPVQPNKPPPSSESQPSGPDIPVNIDLLSISIGRNLAKNFFWNIRTVFIWEQGSGKNPILIGLSFHSLQKSFIGEVFTRKSFQFNKSLMTYRPSGDVAPRGLSVKVENLPDVLFLSDIFSEAASLPAAVPNAISVAKVYYRGDKTTSTMGLEATLVRAEKPGTDNNAVPCPFTWDELSIYAQRVTTATPHTEGKPPLKTSKFAFGAAASFTLNPREQDKDLYSPASIAILLDYTDGLWQVAGHVEDLHFGALVGLMDPDAGVRDAALDILGKLSLTELDVLFTYKAKQPSSFLVTGTVTLGALELRLFYQYVGATAEQGKTAADLKRQTRDPPALSPPAKAATWQLRAYLGAAGGKKATLGEIIDSIAGKDEGTEVIPDFIQSIPIEPAESGSDSAVSLEVAKNDQGAVIFQLSVNVLGIKFSYLQISSTPKPPDGTPALPSSTPAKPTTTRILRITVDKLPLIKDIPLVSQLGQPFDRMLYLYVSGTKGLLQHELEAINSSLSSGDDKLVFKRAVAKPSLTSPVINKGHHFMIVQGGDVILDHVFQISKEETKPPSKDNNKPKALAPPPAPTPGPANQPTKGSLSKSMGPLTISALTLEYKSKTLWIHLDATLTLGPISLTLIGFGVGLSTSGLKLNNLSSIITDNRLSFGLRGMSIAFDRPPVLIAGMFEHSIDILTDGSSASSYRGGVGIGFPPYTFVGVGEYSEVTSPKGGTYKSIFLFAKLDGPLVTLEFATIGGVRLGFGFNSLVRSPSINELTEFPFIKNSSADGASRNPMAILKSMTPGWVTPREGSYWLAAGLTITSFDIIAITAVAMFAFRDSGVVISVFADAVAQLPPHVPDPNGVILYVEIGMVAEMNFVEGYFRVEASLAPSSYLLVPQCRLTGGFALAYWFGNNPNAGDWVFSVGGYHRAFKPPPYYPVPSRLGISFTIGDNIQMRGESYFAITPKAAMAGALIHVSLSVGPVSAYLDASFDALINFHPFHYIVEFSVSVGVECDIDIWFIHIHISIHIGADLHIEGPEFGGIAHVDFWFFGFDIEFGARIGRPPPLELLEFWKTTHQPGPGTSERQDTDPNPVQAKLVYDDDFVATLTPPKKITPEIVPNAVFKFILEEGNFPMPSASSSTTPSNSVPSTGAGATWHVKGGTFRFGVTTEFAIASITIVGTTDTPKPTLSNPSGGQPSGQLKTQSVFSSPMHVKEAITSSLTITIRRVLADGSLSSPIPLWRDVLPNKKAVPTAMWSPYDSALDLMARGPRSGPPPALLDGSSGATRTQTMGVSLSAPWPVISIAKIPKFKASAMARMAVLDIVKVKRMEKVKDKDGNVVKDKDGKEVEEEVEVDEGRDWFIPPIEDTQSRFMGRVMTKEEKGMDAVGRWEKVQGEWKEAATKGADVMGEEAKEDGLLSLASGVFGWGDEGNRPVGEQVKEGERKPWALSGKMPKKLVDGLMDFYLDLPRVCV